VRLTDAIEEFLEHILSVRRLSEATLKAYRGDLRQFSEFALEADQDLDVRRVDASLIETFAAACAHLSVRTVSRKLSCLSSLFTFLRRRGHVPGNPLDAVPRPQQPKTEPAWVTDADIRELLGVTEGPMERALLLAFVCAGLRRSEVMGLDLDDLDLEAGELHVRQGKGQRDRTIPLTDELREALAQYLRHQRGARSPALFTSGTGARLSSTSLQRLWTKWLRAAGLQRRRYKLHSLRHAAATRWIRAGMNVRDVQGLLGHADVSTTSRYLHSSPEHVRKEMAEKVPRIGRQTTEVLAGTPGIPADVAEGLAVLGKLAKVAGLAQLLEREPAEAK
jgi:site-specific recombinase XerD